MIASCAVWQLTVLFNFVDIFLFYCNINSIECLQKSKESNIQGSRLNFNLPKSYEMFSLYSPCNSIMELIEIARSHFSNHSVGPINPFTLKNSSRNIVCYFHTFENNLGMKRNFAKYLKEICCLSSDQHFSFKYFQKNAFVRKIFPRSSGLFWPL